MLDLLICHAARPATNTTASPRGRQSARGPLAKQVAFQLSDRRHHGKHELTYRGSSVDAEGKDSQIDPAVMEVLDESEELNGLPAKSIEGVDDQRVA